MHQVCLKLVSTFTKIETTSISCDYEIIYALKYVCVLFDILLHILHSQWVTTTLGFNRVTLAVSYTKKNM